MHVLFLTLFAIVSLRVKCHRTVTHGSLESMQTQRGHLFADLVHVLNVNAKILLSCVASVSVRVCSESFALSSTFRAINRLEALATQSKTHENSLEYNFYSFFTTFSSNLPLKRALINVMLSYFTCS